MTVETPQALRDDGRTFQQLREPQILLENNTVIYKCTDTLILATVHSSSYFQIFVSYALSCNPTPIATCKAFLNLAVQSPEKITVRLHVTTCDKAVPAHLVNAATAALAIFGIATNGTFAVGCSADGSKFDGPESCVFLACGGGRQFSFAERLSDVSVLDLLSPRCCELREVIRRVLCE